MTAVILIMCSGVVAKVTQRLLFETCSVDSWMTHERDVAGKESGEWVGMFSLNGFFTLSSGKQVQDAVGWSSRCGVEVSAVRDASSPV